LTCQFVCHRVSYFVFFVYYLFVFFVYYLFGCQHQCNQLPGKDSSPKWPTLLCGTLNSTYSLTNSLIHSLTHVMRLLCTYITTSYGDEWWQLMSMCKTVYTTRHVILYIETVTVTRQLIQLNWWCANEIWFVQILCTHCQVKLIMHERRLRLMLVQKS